MCANFWVVAGVDVSVLSPPLVHPDLQWGTPPTRHAVLYTSHLLYIASVQPCFAVPKELSFCVLLVVCMEWHS